MLQNWILCHGQRTVIPTIVNLNELFETILCVLFLRIIIVTVFESILGEDKGYMLRPPLDTCIETIINADMTIIKVE